MDREWAVCLAGMAAVLSRECVADNHREHMQPLLKYYTLSQNEQIHIAGWPPLDPFVEGSPGFWSMTADGKH